MNKKAFLERMAKKLSDLSNEEREERLAFYSEMIDDRMEEGLTEEEAVASIGPIEDAPEEKAPPKRKLPAVLVVLLCLGAPVWLSLLIALFAVVLSLYVSVWAVIISLWAVFGSLVGCAAGGLISGAALLLGGHSPEGAALIGAGLVCGGLAIGFYYGCYWATKGTALLTGKFASWCVRKGKPK